MRIQKGTLRWNARGNTSISVITLVLVVLAAVICSLWIIRNLNPGTATLLDSIHLDLENMQIRFSEACNSDSYSARYNPRVERGNLSVSGPEICISASGIMVCSYAVCDTGLDKTITLDKLTYITITRDNGDFGIS